MNSIFTRRSVRKFSDKPIEQEKIVKLLRAAMQAPSSMNSQPWEFIVISDKEKLTKLSTFSPYASSLKWADIGIIVLGNPDRMILPEFWEQDLAAATQNILLEACELDLGAVWYGTAPQQDKMDFVQKMFETNHKPFCVIGVGYPLKENANKFVDRYDPTRVTYIKD